MLCVFRGPSLSMFRPVLERSFNDRQGYIGIHGGLHRARGERTKARRRVTVVERRA